jgi:hypothetical protein
MKPGVIARAALGYLRKNPDEIVRVAINAAALRFGIPIAALRWLVAEAGTGKKIPKDIELSAAPPALKGAATINAMGTMIRAQGNLKIDEVQITHDSFVLTLRVRELKLKVLSEGESPVAMLIKSGALDLSQPGNIVKYLPQRPEAILEAEGERIVVDLMRFPQLAKNARFRTALKAVAPVLGVHQVETEGDHIYLRLRPRPRGLLQAARSLRQTTS